MIVKVFNTGDGLQAVVMRGNDSEGNPDVRVIKEVNDSEARGTGASFKDCEEGMWLRDQVFMSVNNMADVDSLLEMGLSEWLHKTLRDAMIGATAGTGKVH